MRRRKRQGGRGREGYRTRLYTVTPVLTLHDTPSHEAPKFVVGASVLIKGGKRGPFHYMPSD